MRRQTTIQPMDDQALDDDVERCVATTQVLIFNRPASVLLWLTFVVHFFQRCIFSSFSFVLSWVFLFLSERL